MAQLLQVQTKKGSEPVECGAKTLPFTVPPCDYPCTVRVYLHPSDSFWTRPETWPLQGIRSLRGYCSRINNLLIPPVHLRCPHCCNTIAGILHSIRLPFRPPECMPYTIQHRRLQYLVKANLERAAVCLCASQPHSVSNGCCYSRAIVGLEVKG